MHLNKAPKRSGSQIHSYELFRKYSMCLYFGKNDTTVTFECLSFHWLNVCRHYIIVYKSEDPIIELTYFTF